MGKAAEKAVAEALVANPLGKQAAWLAVVGSVVEVAEEVAGLGVAEMGVAAMEVAGMVEAT